VEADTEGVARILIVLAAAGVRGRVLVPPGPDGVVSRDQRPEADVNIEFQSNSDLADESRDLAFVSAVREAAAGRADIRIDANQGYSREQALAFAAGLDPDGIALFEQPCGKEDWAANLAVARVSPAPVMLDESVVRPADIERAGAAEGVGFVKLKLKKTVTRRMLAEGLARIRALGMTPVMGDGVACAIACWHEALVARTALDNAGEMNGYLKPAECFLAEPLGFREVRLTAPAGWRPVLDVAAVLRMTAAVESC